ncbi:hypothetical protein Anas_08842 [Armadillidium nasatum]|uniref:Uncharacterized protein n=1 Tax=Armadillidium nasatum TaxID=96803 RepID=A0A5N5TGH7_9CRUS|nr:hypothetical protein Anas_08842 [Armadillidium nasatum]
MITNIVLALKLKYIIEVEGPMALWRGLGPNLVGVAPSRAIYFCSYSQMKKALTTKLSFHEGPFVHILSASWAGNSLNEERVKEHLQYFQSLVCRTNEEYYPVR